MIPGELTLQIVSDLEHAGIAVVYLRNHEELPNAIGNDVDLLLRLGDPKNALTEIKKTASAHGWKVIRHVQFSPISVFLTSIDFSHSLHIDLFDRLEWHCVEYAASTHVLRNRRWNGLVHHPALGDEVFINVCTRLIYQGVIRDKHRSQVMRLIDQGMREEVQTGFINHLGPGLGTKLGDAVARGDWAKALSLKSTMRFKVMIRYGLLSPRSALTGIFRYLTRSLRRLLKPPGPFVVFEGADGVGKSTIIERLLPLFSDLTGRTDTLLFHWKPDKRSVRIPGQPAGATSDPRANRARTFPLSLLYLCYHWFGFWVGYFKYVYPARVKNRAVVGDRYSYEFFLDPRRLRLSCPDWILKLAAHTVPLPQMVIALVAAPSVVIHRKPELSHTEIESYQEKLRDMADKTQRVVMIDTEGTIDSVAAEISTRIISLLARLY